MKFKRKGVLLSNAILMFLVLVLGLLSCSFDKDKENVEPAITADGIDYNNGDEIDMPENVIFRYDGTDRASSLTLKATISPNTAINKKLEWSLVWADGGTHGTTSSYVTLTPSSDTLSCTVSCKSGFNYQLKVIVKSQATPSVSASCTLDYEKRISYIDMDYYFVQNACEGCACKLTYVGEDEDGSDNFYVNFKDICYDENYFECCCLEDIYLLSPDYNSFIYRGTVMSSKRKKFAIYGTFEWLECSEDFEDYYQKSGKFQTYNDLRLDDLYGITGTADGYYYCEEMEFFNSLYEGLLKISYTIEDEYGSCCLFNVFYYME